VFNYQFPGQKQSRSSWGDCPRRLGLTQTGPVWANMSVNHLIERDFAMSLSTTDENLVVKLLREESTLAILCCLLDFLLRSWFQTVTGAMEARRRHGM
jgi:hypothetical protein